MQEGFNKRQWFNNLTSQEQIIVVIGATAVICYIVIVLLWRPLIRSEESLEQKNLLAAESLQAVTGLAANYSRLVGDNGTSKNASKNTTKKNLTSLIDELVKKNQLVMKRFQPSSSGDIQIRFENSPFPNILALLNQLEVENNVTVKDLSISPGSLNGVVDISIRLNGGA